MPVWFDMPTSKTVNSVGTKTVLLKTTGHKKTRSQSYWHALQMQPNFYWWSSSSKKLCQKTNSLLAQWNIITWRDGWTKVGLKFGSRRSGEHDWEDLQTPKVYLFGTQQQLCENKTSTAVIPGGLVQPLDVCLNKPFKDLYGKNGWLGKRHSHRVVSSEQHLS